MWQALIPIAASAVSSGLGFFGSKKAGKNAAKAAQAAADARNAAIQAGLSQSGQLYDRAQGYLDPYASAGTDSLNWLRRAAGLEGEDGSALARGAYDGSVSSSLLRDVIANTSRDVQGSFAGGGGLRSGAMSEALTRRLADVNLNNYGNWENLLKGFVNTGANASGQASGNAMSRGSQVLAAYTGMGENSGNGIIGAANAKNAGNLGAMGYVQNFLGKLGQMDFGSMMGGGGGGAPASTAFGNDLASANWS